MPWRHVSRTGEPSVTAAGFLTPQEQGNIVGYFALLMRCNDNVPTGDEASMESFVDFLNSRINGVKTFNSQQKCQRDATIRPITQRRGARGPQQAVSYTHLDAADE